MSTHPGPAKSTQQDLRTEAHRHRDAEAANIKMVELDDGHFEAFGYHNQANTPSGLVWRLISSPEQGTAVVVPYQAPKIIAPVLCTPPAEFQSVLFEVKWILWRMANLFRVGLYDVDALALKEAQKRTAKWRKQNPLPDLDEWEDDRAKYHQEKGAALRAAGLADEDGYALDFRPPKEEVDKWIADDLDVKEHSWAYQQVRHKHWADIEQDLCKKYRLEDPARMVAVNQDRAKLHTFEDAAEQQARTKFQAKANAEKVQERQAIHAEVEDFIRRKCGLPSVSQKQVDEVFAVFFSARQAANGPSVMHRHERLAELTGKISVILGTNVYGRIASHFPNRKVRRLMEHAAKGIAERRGLTLEQAMEAVCRRIKFVATFPPRSSVTPVLIRDIIRTGHSLEDNLYWRSVAPFTAENITLEARKKSLTEEAELRVKLFAVEEKAKDALASKENYRPVSFILERIGKSRTWWNNHINAIHKIAPPHYPDEKLRKQDVKPHALYDLNAVKGFIQAGGGRRTRTVNVKSRLKGRP